MANPTNTEISVSKAGATGMLTGAPIGTALPTDATTTLAAAFKGYGYVGEDGTTPTRDISTDPVRDSNGDQVYTLQTDFTRTYAAPLLQYDNVDIKKQIFGDANVVVTPATATKGTIIAVQDKGQQASHQVLVVTTFSGAKSHREVAADAQITSVEIGALTGTGIRQYTVTWTVYKDSAGVFVYEYDDDGVKTA